jgi:hypothetical protein
MAPLGPFGHVVSPFAKAGRCYAQTWSRYLGGESADLPVVFPDPTPADHALMDQVLVSAFRVIRGLPDVEVQEFIDDALVQSGLVGSVPAEA